MLHQLIHPGVSDQDTLLASVVVGHLETLLVGGRDDIGHVLTTEGAHHAEEEVPLREFT